MSSARRPSSVSRIARARSASPRCSDFDRSRNTARSAASAVSFDFPGMLGLHSPHPRQTIHSIAHSQAVCLGLAYYVFEDQGHNGILFSWDAFRDDSELRSHGILSANKTALRELKIEGYGSEEPDWYLHYLRNLYDDTLTRWSCLQLIEFFEKGSGRMRDRARELV